MAGDGQLHQSFARIAGPQGAIYAVDRDGKAIASQRAALAATPGAALQLIQADFTQPIKLPPRRWRADGERAALCARSAGGAGPSSPAICDQAASCCLSNMIWRDPCPGCLSLCRSIDSACWRARSVSLNQRWSAHGARPRLVSPCMPPLQHPRKGRTTPFG